MTTTTNAIATPVSFFPVFEETLYLNLGKAVAEDAVSTSRSLLPRDSPFVRRHPLDRWFSKALAQTVSENEPLVSTGDILNLALLPVDPRRVRLRAVDHHLDHLRFVDAAHREDKRRLLGHAEDRRTREREGGGEADESNDRTGKATTSQARKGDTEESEWARFSDRVAQMVAHFGEAVRRCGHRVTSEVFGLFRRIHGSPVGKRDLARLVAMHAPSKAAALGRKISKKRGGSRRIRGKPARRHRDETETATETETAPATATATGDGAAKRRGVEKKKRKTTTTTTFEKKK